MNFSFGAPSTQPTSLVSTPNFSFATTTPVQVQPLKAQDSAVSVMSTTSNAGQPVKQDAPTLASATSTVQSAPSGNQMNYFQLEEFINKWTLELEEQEKLFTNQATQVNAWDKVLLSNGEKIVELNESVEKVKAEQGALEQELEFIAAQHAELEECIVPLEEELAKIPQVDMERGQTYCLAESLDSQLKQMSEDLKEVVEHLNEANKYSDPNDPIVQIGKILNAHMSSLQWIEQSTSTITQRLEDISKLHETIRKDNERSFRLTYDS